MNKHQEEKIEPCVLLRLKDIVPNPNQPRKHYDEEKLRELAESILEIGVLQPIIVQPNNGGYEAIAGSRRVRAAELAGIESVPAIIKNDLNKKQALIYSLIENLQREDLNPIDEAEAFNELVKLGLTQTKIAKKVGKTQSHIAHRLSLLKLSEPVKEMVISRVITASHAEKLAEVKEPELQKKLAKAVVEAGLTLRELERMILERRNSQSKPKGPSEPQIRCEFHRLVVELLKTVETGCD